MRSPFLIAFLLISIPQLAQEAKLGPSINRTGSNNFYPALSGDGRYMLYRSDLAHEGDELWMTRMSSSGQWGLQERFNRVIDLPGVNSMGGHYLNIDGSLLFFASKRYGSIGGFDIWFAERKGNNWDKPQNAGMPLNTKGHEGDPSLSPDGKTLYFVRCEGYNVDEALQCSIWSAQRKSNGYFEEPVKLPSPINTGHETSPLILADNASLVFASARAGGKGGLDLYLSRKSDDGWSEPLPMEFLNTENDDRYVSIPARGDISYYSRTIDGKRSLYMAKIPEELRPYNVLYLESRAINNSGSPVPVTVQYSPVDQASKFLSAEENGTFSVILKEGNAYDLAVLDKEGKHLFQSERLDLTELEISRRERKEFVIEEIKEGSVQPLNNIYFKPFSAEIADDSDKELQRLIFLMQKNPRFNIEITVALEDYKQDTVRSDPDLTEVIVDTVTRANIVEKVDTIWNTIDFESLLYNPEIDYIMADSVLLQNTIEADRVIDSLNNVISSSHGSFETSISYDTVMVTQIEYTYHNDRSEQQAMAIANYLKSKGAPPARITTVGIKRADSKSERALSISARFN